MRNRHPHALPLLGAASLALATLVGCGALPANVGDPVTRDRPIEKVSAVVLATSGTLTIATGAEPSLSITAGEGVIDELTSDVRDGVLVLDVRRGRLGRIGTISYELVLPTVDHLRVDGSGDARADLAPGDELTLEVAGSGGVAASGVDVDELAVEISGSGSVEVEGTAGRQSVNLSGSGEYSAPDLTSDEAAVSVEGSGDADVRVARTLDADVSGSGSIRYAGDATVTSNVSGSGGVEPR